jgi:hypothetical protein
MSTTTGSSPATIEDYANLTFQPVKGHPKERVSREAWLDRAGNEYVLFRYAVALLEKNDVELAAIVRKVGGETMKEFLDSFDSQEKICTAGSKMLATVQVRILASMARVYVGDGDYAPPRRRRKAKPSR